ncbi:hypothetical protein D187_001044 [Cystobacter fuscus DSM 2262]|uniref:Uncharacterized protein n=1 Tax=Cystobacter fuscus (strain ATCC 25194 / DSM 2262 / NBRC 100088 / M29) TaxID=1242864 RepID=S9PDY1_CYSF2|nr:hypothetical protein [Cystobacter fuscus]EPX61261.1 hypothetical protein D187_001044 [Cystobacter fuscus DSM 2262]
MMKYQQKIPNLSDIRATHYSAGADHLFYMDSGRGDLWWLPVNPVTLLLSKTETLTQNKRLNLNAFASQELQWLWESTGSKRLLALNSARILPLGATSLEEVSPASLAQANWDSVVVNNSVPEDGTSTTGRIYAVRIPNGGEFHYVKLRVFKANNQTWIEWFTYSTSPNAYRLSTGFLDVRDILLSEYETALYLTAQYPVDGQYYVLTSPRASTALSPYPDYTSQAQPVHDTPLTEPQQMALDDGFLYVVDDTSLWRIDLSTRNQVCLVEGLTGGTGLLLSTLGSSPKVCLSDASGNVFVVDLPSSVEEGLTLQVPAQPTYSLGTQSGFMAWANQEHSALYICLHGTKKVARIDLLTGEITTEGEINSGTVTPRSIEPISDTRMYVAGETEIGQFSREIEVANHLLLGIGLIPFEYINNSQQLIPTSPDSGKVNTSSAPGYYFSAYANLPFAGNLSLMVNHELAWTNGVRFYSVKIKNLSTGVTRSIIDTFHDMKWDALASPPRFMNTPTSVVGNLFPIRNPAVLWYNPYLAALIKTSTLDNGHNVLTVDFFDGNKQAVANGSFSRLIYIDNTRCNVRLELPRVGSATTPPAALSYPTLECGCLAYVTKNDLVELDFVAWQPQGSGSYSLRISGGGAARPKLAQDGTVTASPLLVTKKLTSDGKPIRAGHILGDCDVANVLISLSVPSRVIDGYGWVNLGATTQRTFTLIKGPISHSPWNEPA